MRTSTSYGTRRPHNIPALGLFILRSAEWIHGTGHFLGGPGGGGRESGKNDVSPAKNGDALYPFTTSTIVLHKYTNIPE